MNEPQGYAKLHFRTFREEGQWVGRCVELGISTCADTRAQAQAGIVEAAEPYLETLDEEGILEQTLVKQGVSVVNDDTPSDGEEWEEPVAVPAGRR